MLAAGIVMPSGGPGTDVVPVAVAHMRCTAAAAIQLRDAIDKALLIGTPVQNPEGKANSGTALAARVSPRPVSSRSGTATIEIPYACRPRIDGNDERQG
jgi:hypothetical protein